MFNDINKLRKFTQGTIILIIDSCPLIFGLVSTNYEEFGYSLPFLVNIKIEFGLRYILMSLNSVTLTRITVKLFFLLHVLPWIIPAPSLIE